MGNDDMLEKVLAFFRTIGKIPRKSGDEKKISDFILQFAKQRGFSGVQDKHGNLIISKKASCGCQDGTPLVLQGHLDMVYVEEDGYTGAYSQGITTRDQGEMIYARGTSLGADNGIALAYMLLLLDSHEIVHPDLEFIFTVEEEVGLAGAQSIDLSEIRGRHLINLDSEEEGVVYTSCAGGIRNVSKIKLVFELKPIDKVICIGIKGLKGGHSGIDIGLGKGNAIKIMGRLLASLNDIAPLNIVDINCDGKANAIPNRCDATIAFENYTAEIKDKMKQMALLFAKELQGVDNIEIDYEIKSPTGETDLIDQTTSQKIINYICLVPNGVDRYDNHIPHLVETSSNVGAVTCDKGTLEVLTSIRSSLASRKYHLTDTIKRIADILGIEAGFFNDYPQWEYRQTSLLRKVAMAEYEKLFGKKARKAAIHAGLECGYFSEKIKGLDMISIGPDLYDVHTCNEHISVKSVSNTLALLLSIMKEFCSGKVKSDVGEYCSNRRI